VDPDQKPLATENIPHDQREMLFSRVIDIQMKPKDAGVGRKSDLYLMGDGGPFPSIVRTVEFSASTLAACSLM